MFIYTNALQKLYVGTAVRGLAGLTGVADIPATYAAMKTNINTMAVRRKIK